MNQIKNQMSLANGEAINTKIAGNGKNNWLFVNKLHEIGGDRQREERKTFATQEDAKAFFDEQAARFCKTVGRSHDASVKLSESELLIHIDGVQIIKMTYLAVPLQCA